MYNPTDKEKKNCEDIVKEILELESDSDCERYVTKIFKTIYSIGGDYGEKTIKAVAEALYDKK